MKIKYFAILFLFSISSVLLFGEISTTENKELNLKDYILQTLKVSTSDFQKAENEMKDASADYNYAKQNSNSVFEIEKALIYLEKMRNYKVKVQSDMITKAVYRYYYLLQTERNFHEKEEQLSIDMLEEKIAKLRLAEGVKEESEYADQKIITIESRIMVVKAENSYLNAYRRFLRGIGMEYGSTNLVSPEKSVPVIPLGKMEFEGCLDIAEQKNPSCVFNLKMYDLFQSYNDKIINSTVVTVKEKRYSNTQMNLYKINYEESVSTLENTIWSLVTENNIAVDILKFKKTQKEIAENQLHIKRIEYSNGTIFKTELLQAELDYEESQNDLITEMETIFQNYIQLRSVTGKNIQQLCNGS